MDRNAIWLFRHGSFVADYGYGLSTEKELGQGLQRALRDSVAGDEIVTGPFQAAVSDLTLDASKVHLACHSTRIVPDGKHSHLLKLAGSDCVVSGLVVDGGARPNPARGYGIWVVGDRNRVLSCTANGNRGANYLNGDGSGIKIDNAASDTVIKDFASDDAGYAAVWLMGDRTLVSGAYITNPYRAFSINSFKNLEWMSIGNVVGIATEPGKSVLLNSNIDDGVELDELKLTNVSLVDTDMISPGVSYNSSTGHQMAKLQNTRRIVLQNVNLEHGTNAGSGIVRTLYIQEYMGNKAPEELIIRDSTFSDAMLLSLKIPYLEIEGSVIARRSLRNYASAFRPKVGMGHFVGNTIYVHQRQFALTPDWQLETTDRLEFRYNSFIADHPGKSYVHKRYSAGMVTVDGTNRLTNRGGGSFEITP